ncbi:MULTISPECIES: outer membrane lipoprotein chaperone LolA [Gammaproteobacteria]|uniref:outer membrane lipoprotein chaperone LolA n=1 Tax=Gammaproteobacteria TaxID=1236 RepID=UPI000DD08C46|nr:MULTISPECIES: outer membrane lipoprotein chaperone LolA [Gammaproteobacteria]RTE87179.1 outer membrane lipoprotein carrier protein LolA [Aliidiomarina sp. B3213]TCZ93033.1 outer membrane lipoprotein chaperone LolA [Lysobacter sp. N42]
MQYFKRFVILITVGCALTVLSVQAQQEQSEALTSLKANLDQIETLAGDFEQTVYENNEVLQSLSGNFVLARDSLLRWETLSPEPSTLVADGETLWYYDPFIEQVSLFDQQQMTESNALLVLLETSAELEGMRVTRDNLEWSIQGEDESQSLRMNFSPDGVLQGLHIQTGMNQFSVITFTNLQVNDSVDSNIFEFQIPEGVMVDDQR